jgi:hypothetical protein
VVGPVFAAIEKVLFKMKWFIKKVPVRDRARHVCDRLYFPGSCYYATDYSAFESHFDAELMEVVEMQLYEYMTSQLPEGSVFMKMIRDVIASPQTCLYKGFVAENIRSRMSGEMCTSLGNSFSNLMIFLFACSEAGIDEEEVDGFVEGDDGLFRLFDWQKIDDAIFTRLGLTIKMEKQTELHLASFCGLIFDPQSFTIITDPRKVLAEFGWADCHYVRCGDVRLKELLRAKALSFAHQYPGCPIVQSLAQYGLRMTRHIDMRRYLERARLGVWSRERLLEALDGDLKPVPVTRESRDIVESKFGIPVSEQIAIEKLLDSKNDLSPIDLGAPVYFPSDWEECYYGYVFPDMGDYPVCFRRKNKFDNIPHETDCWSSDLISSTDPFLGADWKHRVWSA